VLARLLSVALALAFAGGSVPLGSPVVLVAGAQAPDDLCATSDRRLTELSGLVGGAVGGPGRFAITDGGRRVQIHELGANCSVRRTITDQTDPYDGEDLARAADGTFWLADIGDNELRRETVAFILVGQDGPARLHRVSYPDGPHDAEALLLGRDGVPVIVTKDPTGVSGVYMPEGPLAESGTTPLRRAGAVELPSSTTVGGPVGRIGSRLVTGGAVSADGRVVALRSYTDAWLYPAPDGDPVAALTREPVQVPLPGEPQGEAIAFEPDGTLLSGSESTDAGVGMLRAVRGAAGLVDLPPVDGSSGTGAAIPGGVGPWQLALVGLGVAGVASVAVVGFRLLRRWR
jgi:hypothetical protein